MKFGQIKCTNCGADLEVDLDKGFAICPYCENKMYANYSDDLLIEKEKTKQKIYELGKEIEKTRQTKSPDHDRILYTSKSDHSHKHSLDYDPDENIVNWTWGLFDLLFVEIGILIFLIIKYFN